MTVVINYVSQFISLIATDTRVSYGKHGEMGYNDDEEKLINIPYMGWSAGAGWAYFLDDFKEKLAQKEITITTQISEIYRQSREEMIKTHPAYAHAIDKSAVTFSWIGLVDESVWLCRMGLMSGTYNNEVALLKNESFSILYPGEFLDNPDKAKTFENEHNFEYVYTGDLNELLNKVLSFFKEIYKDVATVSRICDIGLYFFSNEGICKARIKGDFDFLLQKILDGALESEIIEFIPYSKES